MTQAAENTLLSIRHATVRYLDKILFPALNFTMRKGENWAVLGKSGAGKTALLQTILGKFLLVNGSLHHHFYEDFLRNHPDGFTGDKNGGGTLFNDRQLMALVSQQPHFRNKQNMPDFYYQQRFNAWDSEEAARVSEYLDQTLASTPPELLVPTPRFPKDWVIENLRLSGLLDKTLIQLSNGETRRLLLAQALLTQPLLLLLDNPFTGLDSASRPFFHQLLGQIAQKGTQLILVTTPGEIPDCMTHVLELEGGNIKNTWTREAYLQEAQRTQKPGAWQPDERKLSRVREPSAPEVHPFKKAVSMVDISIQYGNTLILDQVSWEIQKGEKWALLGPNGAGKSTLLSLISGDNPQAYANTIHLFDRRRGSGESIWDIKHKIGFVSPEMHQYFQSGSHCLDVVLSGYTDTMSVIRKRISEKQVSLALAWMDLLDISRLRDQKFKEVSAGAQRLILLIRALVKNPPLLILDEPCQGLDTEQKTHFKRVIETVTDDKDKTLIYVTHYAEEIPRSVDRVLRLDQGRIVPETTA